MAVEDVDEIVTECECEWSLIVCEWVASIVCECAPLEDTVCVWSGTLDVHRLFAAR